MINCGNDRRDVVHQLVEDPSVGYLGRIVALPGDHIQYSNREMTINGQRIPLSIRHRDESYQYTIERIDERDVDIVLGPEIFSRDFDQVVPSDHYIVFGDNRDNSRDSRYIDAIPKPTSWGGWRRFFGRESDALLADANSATIVCIRRI